MTRDILDRPSWNDYFMGIADLVADLRAMLHR